MFKEQLLINSIYIIMLKYYYILNTKNKLLYYIFKFIYYNLKQIKKI